MDLERMRPIAAALRERFTGPSGHLNVERVLLTALVADAAALLLFLASAALLHGNPNPLQRPAQRTAHSTSAAHVPAKQPAARSSSYPASLPNTGGRR